MRIAIQNSTEGFNIRWIEYCQNNNIPYKVVDAYSPDIIKQLQGCDVFMWHYHHENYKDALFAKQLLYSLEMAGKKVFPDFHTSWHFDDKVGQKYLLEGIGAPLVPSYVFYSKDKALQWLDNTDFPKVFKLRGGAGASNVMLVNSKKKARNLVNKAFGRGFSTFNRCSYLTDRYKKWKSGKDTFLGVLKGIARLVIPTEFARMHGREKGYVYFQDFIPNNTFDIRIVVVGSRAFAIKRLCRTHDFRASGSGSLVYDKTQIDVRCVRIAFDVNEKIKAESIAYDFVIDEANNPLIVEISYGYAVRAYDKCEGYWTKDMKWHPGSDFNFCGWMIEDLIKFED